MMFTVAVQRIDFEYDYVSYYIIAECLISIDAESLNTAFTARDMAAKFDQSGAYSVVIFEGDLDPDLDVLNLADFQEKPK